MTARKEKAPGRAGTSAPAPRASSWIWLAIPVCYLLVGSALTLRLVNDSGGLLSYPDVFIGLLTPVFGALVIRKQPTNAVGWLLVIAGLFSALTSFTPEYALWGKQNGGFGWVWAGWISTWCWIPPVAVIAPFLPLLFPSGHFRSRLWGMVGIAAGVTFGLGLVAVAFLPKGMGYHTANPAVVHGLIRHVLAGIPFAVVPPLCLGFMVVSIAGVLLRLMAARGEERTQLQWFLYGLVSVIVGIVAKVLTDNDIFSVVGVIALTSCITVAMLKYRLYDIDRIVSRTLAYALVTAVLAGCYLLMVLALQLILPVETRSPVVVAVSTLAVAALFRPARHRAQALIDKRFNRAHFDASATLEAFAGSLSSEVDIEALLTSLSRMVATTMQPARVSVWLRQPR